MVLQRGSNALATRIEWFCNADWIVLQRGLNGFATRIEWFGIKHRMVLQRGSNGFATHIEWFCNADRMVWQHTSNTFATHIELIYTRKAWTPPLSCWVWVWPFAILNIILLNIHKHFTLALHDCCTLTSTADYCSFARHTAKCSTGLPKVFIKFYQCIRTHEVDETQLYYYFPCILELYGQHLLSSQLQFGFKPGLSSTICTSVLKGVVSQNLREGSVVYGCLIDASKAFDIVDHNILFEKLITRGLSSPVLCFLFGWYQSQHLRV